MKRKRICLFSHLYPTHPEDYKGIRVRDLARRLARHGWEVHVVTPRRPPAPARESADGVQVHRYRFYRWAEGRQLGTLNGYPPLMLGTLVLAGFFHLLRVVLAHRIRLIHAYWVVPGGFIGAWVGLFTGARLVATAAGSDLNRMAQRKFIRPMVRFTLWRLGCLITNGSALRDVAIGLGMRADRIRTLWGLGSPIPVTPADPSDSRDSEAPPLTLSGDPGARLLCVGNLVAPKRVDTLLRAFAVVAGRHPTARLNIIGGGDQEPALAAQAAELCIADRVQFHGAQPHHVVLATLCEADIFLHASDHEGLPVAVMEAMACGLPVVASDVGGVPDLVKPGETGFLAAPDDSAAYAEAIGQLLSDPALRVRIGAAARDHAQTYTNEDRWMEHLESAYAAAFGREEL
jgi:glycosyltransferase involved in cell wall biosynthesis